MIKFMLNEMVESVILLEKQLGLKPCVSQESENTIVYIFEDKVIAFLVWVEAETSADLLNIGVDTAYQKQGIATELLKHWISVMQARRMKQLYCEVRISNKHAINLYLKSGFKVNRRRTEYYSDPTEDALEMRYEYE